MPTLAVDHLPGVLTTFNTTNAETRRMVAVALPPGDPKGHGAVYHHDWSDAEYDNYKQHGIPPLTNGNLPNEEPSLLFWAFDARHSGGELPEVELDPKPDFEKYPALVVFEMENKKTLFLQSEELELKPVPNKENFFQFVKKQEEKTAMEELLEGNSGWKVFAKGEFFEM